MNQLTNSTPQPATPLHCAEELTEGGIRADISLGEKVYTLRITRSGKLILTK
ncbi:MAG: hemin uptake protein HemP [Paracoccaceae bacterium]